MSADRNSRSIFEKEKGMNQRRFFWVQTLDGIGVAKVARVYDDLSRLIEIKICLRTCSLFKRQSTPTSYNEEDFLR